jgi:hypothetical protein
MSASYMTCMKVSRVMPAKAGIRGVFPGPGFRRSDEDDFDGSF